MPRSMILIVSSFLFIVITSHFEPRYHRIIGNVEARPTLVVPQKLKPHHMLSLSESLKEKIILSQEKSIQKLNELVKSLQEQLQMCTDRGKIAENESMPFPTEILNKLGHPQILED